MQNATESGHFQVSDFIITIQRHKAHSGKCVTRKLGSYTSNLFLSKMPSYDHVHVIQYYRVGGVMIATNSATVFYTKVRERML